MTTAFVLSGGASLGASQVGMLLGLATAGITPDLIVGTSVGALNGGWVAMGPDVDGIGALADVWRSLSRSDVFPTHPIVGLLGFLGRRPHLVPDKGLRPPIPAASPPGNIDGRDLIDGGVVNNTPLSHAVALGADRVWVLPTGYACALRQSPQGALAMALHGVTLTINQRLAVDIARFEEAVDVRVIPPLCPIGTSPVDFSHSASLIEHSHRATEKWLRKRHRVTGQAALLEPHRH